MDQISTHGTNKIAANGKSLAYRENAAPEKTKKI